LTRLVIVTGTTGSGKTTTCKEFVALADDLWLHFGVDTMLGTLVPRKFVDGGTRSGESLHMAPDDPADPEGPAHMSFGRQGGRLIDSYHRMVRAAVENGERVILDHVTTMDPPILPNLVAHFRDLDTLFVALKPPQHILGTRIEGRIAEVEKVLGKEQAARNNAGTRRASQFVAREIFRHDRFDMVLDTGALSPAEVACAILERVEKGPPGDALRRLRQEPHLGSDPVPNFLCREPD
jgi:chloramphenicol 3-O-phosphotransferase